MMETPLNFPAANRKTVDNIAAQLLHVPPFYFKVCKTMQEMLLPVPFCEHDNELSEWALAYDFVTSRVNVLVSSEKLSSRGVEVLGELVKYFRDKQLRELKDKLLTESLDCLKPLAKTALKLITPEALQAENARVKRHAPDCLPMPTKAVKVAAEASVYDNRPQSEDILQAAEIKAQCVGLDCKVI
jgi:hypothetical protein